VSAAPTATEAQAATNGQTQAVTTEDTTITETTQAVESISLDEAKKLRSEAQSLRNRLKSFEKSEQERKDAELTEVERRDTRIKALEGDLTAAQQRERTYALRDAIDGATRAESFAHTLNAPVADVLLFLPDDLDPADGKAVGKALTELAASKAYLFAAKAKRPGSADAGATGTTESNPGFGEDRLRHAYGNPQSRR